MKDRIIEIVELGQPQSLIQRENAHTTELIKTDLLIEELNEQLRQPLVSGELLSDKAIEEYAFKTYHDVEDSRWFEPLQVGAKWSRDTLIAEIQRRQQMIIAEPDCAIREKLINDLLAGLQ